MYASLRQLAVEQLQTLDADVRLVLLHPNYPEPHFILSYVMQDERLLYVRFHGRELTETRLREQFDEALAAYSATNGAEPDYGLILDECDRGVGGEFDAFLTRLVGEGRWKRIFVLSRAVPKCVLENADLRAQTRFVPYDEALMLWDYTRYDTSQSALLEVRALGTGRVLLNGRRVENWDGVLPRSLFFYLIDRGMTTRADIFQTFWPTLSVREATNVFHVTKRKISEVLGMDLTVYWSGYYHIAPHIQLSYDAALFSQATQDAAILPVEESGTLLRQAITLYRGHFLTSIDMDWTRKRREELLFNFNEALMGLARVYECHHQPQKALALYLQAAATNVQREDLVHNMMRLYSDMGKAGEALLLYERLREELQQTLGVEPAPQLQALAASIQQKSGAAV